MTANVMSRPPTIASTRDEPQQVPKSGTFGGASPGVMFSSPNAKNDLPPKNGSAQNAPDGRARAWQVYLDAWERILDGYALMARTAQSNAVILEKLEGSHLAIQRSRDLLGTLRIAGVFENDDCGGQE